MSRRFGEVRDGVPYDNRGVAIQSCIESIPDGGRAVTAHNCGKKLKGDPEYPHLCGFHISVIERARKKASGRDELKRQLAKEDLDIKRRAKEASVALGIDLTPRWAFPTTGFRAHMGYLTGRVEVELSLLEELVERLKAAEK